MNNEIIEKLKKLIRLGTSDNENESQMAMKRAQALAIEHRIDLALLNAWEDKEAEEKYEKKSFGCGQRFSVSQRFVNWIIERHFNVSIVLTGARCCGRGLCFIGKTSDIEYAAYINEYLNETFMRLWKSYKTKNNAPTSYRASYLLGLYRGLNEALEANQHKAKADKVASIQAESGEEAANKAQASFELMLASEKDKLNKALTTFFPTLKRAARYSVSVKSNVLDDGKRDGASISISRTLTGSCQKQLT